MILNQTKKIVIEIKLELILTEEENDRLYIEAERAYDRGIVDKDSMLERIYRNMLRSGNIPVKP